MRKTKLILLAALIVAPAITRAATVISSLPYFITISGSYVLNSDLTANGQNGIQVLTSNVTIDLGGYTLKGVNGTDYFAIVVSALFTNSPVLSNVTIKNGAITGFDYGIDFENASQCAVKNVRISSAAGVSIGYSQDCLVENCFLVGFALQPPEFTTGFQTDSSSDILVRNCCFSELNEGIEALSGNTSIALIGNYEANCGRGIFVSTGVKYQGNITTNCPVLGGTPIGKENG